MNKIKIKIYQLLRKSEKYTKTDMVYLASGSFWLTGGKIITALSSLALAFFYANFLSKESYATYKYILSFLAIISITGLQGINTSLKRSIAINLEGSFADALKIKIKWGAIIFLLGFILSIYYFYNDNRILGWSFLVASVTKPLISSLRIYNSYTEGKKLFNFSAFYTSTNQIFISICTIIAVIKTDNIAIIISTYLLSGLFISLILFFFTIKKFKLNNKKDEKMISYGKHLSLMGVLETLADNIDKIIMWHLLGPTNLAIYSFATIPVNQIKSFSGSINSIAFPKLAIQNKKTTKKVLPEKIKKFTIIFSVPILIYIFLSPFLYKILFPEYLESIKYSMFFALSLFLVPQDFFKTFLTAQGEKKYLYIIKTATPFVKIFLFITLIPYWGIFGAIISLLISSAISSLMARYFFKKS